MNKLYESILGDIDNRIDKMDKDITDIKIVKKLKKLFNYMAPIADGIDCYGRKLNIGDIVMYVNGATVHFGIIIEFTDEDHEWCLVSPEGDPDGYCDKIFCEETFKLTDKQFLELTKDIR
jgi:hypothetical protein